MPDSAAALSVLVLAWDEAAPTVRTVLEAAPTVGSLLVLLPPALPTPPPPAASPQPAVAGLVAVPVPPATPTVPTTNLPTTDNQLVERSSSTPIAPTLPPAVPAAASAHPAAPPAARLLYLVASELPVTVRSGSFRVPAAPYLGATPTEVALLPARTAPAGNQVILQPATFASPSLPPVASPPATPTNVAATTAPAAVPASTPGGALAGIAAALEPLAKAAFAADEILDPDPEEELAPGSPAQPTAATPADTTHLTDAPAREALSALGPFGNRLPQFDASPMVARPAPVAPDSEDTPEELAAGFAASVAAARQYAAPDLNSQVIRYARLAVPTALAAGRYDVIYAPAWPTWLAALELRQRTSQPLVLHLPALAAGRQPADTAAGWPAEIQRQVLRQADLVLVETYALARRLRRELGLATATVRVVPTHDAASIARALRRALRRPSA